MINKLIQDEVHNEQFIGPIKKKLFNISDIIVTKEFREFYKLIIRAIYLINEIIQDTSKIKKSPKLVLSSNYIIIIVFIAYKWINEEVAVPINCFLNIST